jgi:putative spermidine/putrescine transport system ATP-binding protein
VTIELRNISKTYRTTVALSDVNLRVEEGQFLTLLGPTGCGKSTLLRILAGFVEPSTGDVIVDGERINDIPPASRRIGMLFQNYALFPHRTVEQNVAFGLEVRRISKADMGPRIQTLLSMLGIEHLRDRYPAQISGGQQQRTALARTLAIEPKILLLDEPLAALDRKLKAEMQVELKKLTMRLGITTICVSHDQDEALTMSDCIALMQGGRIEQFGQPLAIYDEPATSFSAGFLGKSNLLRGEVHNVADGWFFRAGSFELPLSTLTAAPNSPHDLLLRPEHLLLSVESVPGAFAGSVLFVTQLGHTLQYEVALDCGPILLVAVTRGRSMMPFPTGTRVFVRPDRPDAYRLVRR